MEKISPTVKTIKAEMDRQEVGVYALAAAAGITASTLYRILDGETVPNLDTVESLLKALDLKIVVKR